MINQKTILDISIIIPFKDKADMTLDCVKSLLKYGPALTEILLISNNSSDDELLKIKYYISANQTLGVRVLEYNHPFNYQKMNNWAVEHIKGKTIMFLNNDTELVENSIGIIEKMYKKSQLANVGVTGCLLLYGDEKTIQHAGVYLMPEGQADHMYITEHYKKVLIHTGSDKYPYDITKDIPMSAVTGAINIVSKAKFIEIGSYDEHFIIGGGDVDLCLRMNQKGYQTWFVSGGYILHKESQSRKNISIPYSDFYWSYLSYIKGYNPEVGDPFLGA